MSRWIIVGISGVTNGGKSTLTKRLLDVLPDTTRHICQDDYFYPEDSPHHVPCPGGLDHHNWDIISSMDMTRMMKDIREIIHSNPKPKLKALEPGDVSYKASSCLVSDVTAGTLPVLLLDGFLLFGLTELTEMCDFCFFFTLSREQCWDRRKIRNYEPPDPPGYFEHCVWPMYEAHLDYVKKNVPDMIFLDGMEDSFQMVCQQIETASKVSPSTFIPSGQMVKIGVHGKERQNSR